MQLGAGVRRSRQATAAETGGLHAEVLTVLLNEDVCGNLAGAEEGVLRLINRHALVDSEVIPVPGFDVVIGVEFHERQTIWRIAIDFVCAREDKRCIWTM